MSLIRVIVTHRRQLMRSALAALVDSIDDVTVVASSSAVDVTLAAQRIECDVLVLGVDVAAEHAAAIVDAVGRSASAAALPLLVVASALTADQLLGLFEAGATGVITADDAPARLDAAIRSVLAGDPVVPSRYVRSLVDAFVEHSSVARRRRWLDVLTDREVDVLWLLRTGVSNAAIAGRLGVSDSTVKSHVSSIAKKLGGRSRSHTVAIANAMSGSHPHPTRRTAPTR